ncbi:MAG: hypothetical protein WCY36_05975 [Candidatus Omnitrophota bacterium]
MSTRVKILVSFIVVCIFCSTAQAAENVSKTVNVENAAGEDDYKDMSKEEMILEIKNEIDSEEGILQSIPNLKRKNDKDGKYKYSYLINGKQVDIENVDKKTLGGILDQVSIQANRISIETIREQQNQRNQLNAVRRPPDVPRPSKR